MIALPWKNKNYRRLFQQIKATLIHNPNLILFWMGGHDTLSLKTKHLPFIFEVGSFLGSQNIKNIINLPKSDSKSNAWGFSEYEGGNLTYFFLWQSWSPISVDLMVLKWQFSISPYYLFIQRTSWSPPKGSQPPGSPQPTSPPSRCTGPRMGFIRPQVQGNRFLSAWLPASNRRGRVKLSRKFKTCSLFSKKSWAKTMLDQIPLFKGLSDSEITLITYSRKSETNSNRLKTKMKDSEINSGEYMILEEQPGTRNY